MPHAINKNADQPAFKGPGADQTARMRLCRSLQRQYDNYAKSKRSIL